MVLPVPVHARSGHMKNDTGRGWPKGLVSGATIYVEYTGVYNGIIVKYS